VGKREKRKRKEEEKEKDGSLLAFSASMNSFDSQVDDWMIDSFATRGSNYPTKDATKSYVLKLSSL